MVLQRGIVQRIVTEPDIHLEYVLDPDKAPFQLIAPDVEWTRERRLAKEMSVDEAQDLAARLGVPARAYVLPAPSRGYKVISSHRNAIPPEEVYEREERRGRA